MKKQVVAAVIMTLAALVTCACNQGNGGGNQGGNNSAVIDTCGGNHDYVQHSAVEATCDTAGNAAYYTCEACDKIFDEDKKAIEEIPAVAALGHAYILVSGNAATCNATGEIDHYICDVCDKIFDLTKKEITDTATDYDFCNHTSDATITIYTQPNKTVYRAGESFDPAGMTVVYKCDDCEGEIVDNQFMPYIYQSGGNAFSVGETKITVHFDGVSFEVPITVEKKKVEIFGVQESYTTACGTEPAIEVTTNYPESEVVIAYYDGATQVETTEFVAGKTYTAKISVAGNAEVDGAEATAQINVEHVYAWQADETNADKFVYKCNCQSDSTCYVMNNQEVYVDNSDMSIDLSSLVGGTDNYSVKSVQQVLLLSGNRLVDIEAESVGLKYTFSLDKYEKLTADYTPYYLKLSVVYTVEGQDISVMLTAKYVEKVIRTAEDLKALAYLGDPNDTGTAAMTGQYVLANDIDATGVVLNGGNPCWRAASGFCGVFNGNGYTISNLSIGAGNHGIFGAVGYNGKIQNVNFTNVNVASGSYLLAYAIRNAFLTNVNVEFNKNSASYGVAYTANACEFANVNVLTSKNAKPFLIDENASIALPESITLTYFEGTDETEKTEVKTQSTLSWGVRTDSGETNEYGKVYNLSREQWYINNNITDTMGTLTVGALRNGLPEGYEYYVFWIYNPTGVTQTLHLAGDVSGVWTDSADSTTLTAGEWTRVVISAADIAYNDNGQWYVYIGNSDADGWKISTIYAAKME